MKLLAFTEAAAMLRLSKQRLWRWRRQSSGPPYMQVDRKILYQQNDPEAWLSSHRRPQNEARHVESLDN